MVFSYSNGHTFAVIVCTGNNEEEVEGKSLGSDDDELSLIDKQVETLKREEIMEAKR